jgi:hypothetical protein
MYTEISSGVKTVGNTSGGTTVQLTDTPTSCAFVILMAPSAKGANSVNDDAIYATYADTKPTHAVLLTGGLYIDKANYEATYLWADDASHVYLAGFVAGDEIHYQIIG